MNSRTLKNSILLVCATKFELIPLIKALKINETTLSKTINDIKVDVLITGVGMVNTTYQLTKRLSKKKYSLVINLGIAGSFSSIAKIGDVVNVTKEKFGDFGAEDDQNFLDIFELNLIKPNEAPFKKGVLIASTFKNSKTLNKLKCVTGLTVNKVHGNANSILKIENKYKANIETMEGAAVFQCCLSERTKVIQIRSISNKVEKRNRNNWNIPLAIANLNTAAATIINEITLNLNTKK